MTMRKPYILIIELIARDCWLECIILIFDLFRAVDSSRMVADLRLVHQQHILVAIIAIRCVSGAPLVLEELGIFLRVHTLCTIFFFLPNTIVFLQPFLVLSRIAQDSRGFAVGALHFMLRVRGLPHAARLRSSLVVWLGAIYSIFECLFGYLSISLRHIYADRGVVHCRPKVKNG